jgi:MFS transporter, DHA1 family, inner membrane transport protein
LPNIKNERVLLALLAAVQFTNIVDFMIMMPMGDILKKTLEISPAKYGWLVSSYGLAAGLTAFVGVFYLDNLDRKKALLTAYAGFMIGTVSSALVPTTDNNELNYWLFVGTRILTGVSGGLLGGLVLSIVGDVIPIERRGRGMAVITIAFSLASVLGVPIALTLVDLFDYNWHVPFYGVSIVSLPVWLLAFRFIPPLNAHLTHRPGKYDRSATFRLAFKRPAQRYSLLFSMLLILGQFTVVVFMTPYMINNVGLEQKNIKYIYLVGGICTVFSGYFIGRMVDRVGRFRVFTIFALLSILTLITITNLPEVSLPWVLVVAGFFFIFISGRMIPANTITSSIVLPQFRAGFMSLNSAAMSIASGLSGVIAGAIVSQENEHSPILHYETVGYVASAATLAALFIVRRMKRIALHQPAGQESGTIIPRDSSNTPVNGSA